MLTDEGIPSYQDRFKTPPMLSLKESEDLSPVETST